MSAHLLPIRVNACVYARPAQGNPPQPMSLSANEPAHWAFREPDYKGAVSHSPVWSRLFETGQTPRGLTLASPRPAVGLSWAMPPGWGMPAGGKEDGPLPLLPDRWLVVRILRPTHNGRAWASAAPKIKTFAIDAAAEGEAGGTPIVVEMGSGGPFSGDIAATRIGLAREGVTFDNSGRQRRVTLRGAPASEDLSFAAFLPAHRNVLGFVDELEIPDEQLRESALSYAVMGWYNLPGEDPLAAKGATAEAIRAALNLDDADPAVPTTAPLGRRSLFHGAVAYIDYFNPKSYLGPETGAPDPRGREPRHPCKFNRIPHPINVGFGPTVEGALAEMITALPLIGGGKLPHVVALLASVLDGSIFQRTGPGGREASDNTGRAGQFHPLPAGTIWHISPAGKGGVGIGGVAAAAANKPGGEKSPRIPDSLIAPLDTLNQAQKAFSRLTWAEQVVADWRVAARLTEYKEPDAPPSDRTVVRQRIEEEHGRMLARVAKADAALASAKGDLEGRIKALNPAKDDDKGTVWTLQRSDDIPFQTPRDPALAFNNIDARLPARRLPRAGRMSSAAPRPTESSPLPLAPVDLAWAESLAADPDLREGLRQLLGEAAAAEAAVASLVKRCSKIIAFSAASNVQTWRKRNAAVIAQLGGAGIQPESRVVDASAPSIDLPGGNGTPLGDVCIFWSEQPWFPVFLDWRASLHSQPNRRMSGRTLLAHRPLRGFSETLARLDNLPTLSDRDRVAISDMRGLSNLKVVGQTLSGLHQQLMRRNDGLPRRVATAVGPDASVLNRLLAASHLAPVDTQSFMLFQRSRQGALRIEQLRVVDLFGQALMIDTASIRATGRTDAGLPLAHRALEPLRLTINMPGVSGWIVPSRMDRAVAVYDGGGRPIMLVGADGRRHLVPAAPPPDEALQGVLDQLGDAAAIGRFLSLCDDALRHVLLEKATGMAGAAALIGRPLAVIRAGIGLERRGGPIIDPAMLQSDEDAQGLLEGGRLKVGSGPEQSVAARLGSRTLPDDGLVCVQQWTNGKPGVFERGAKMLDAGARAPTVKLVMPGAHDPLASTLTLLMDPRGKLYVDTPILPVREAALDGELYEDVLDRLPAMLRVSHLLLPSHAALRAVLTPDGVRPAMAAPLPVRSGKSSVAETGDAQAWLAVSGHGLLPVRPEAPFSAVEPGEVASLAGLLII